MPDLTLDAATEVVAQAIKHEAWSWDDPQNVTDEDVIATAKNLVEVSQQASQGGSVADAVMEILHAANVEPLSEPSKQAYAQRFGGAATNGSNGDVPAEATPAEAQATHDNEQGNDGSAPESDISSIFPGYDDLKVADIKKAILESAGSGDLKPHEWEQIKAYEADHEERKTILSLEPEFKAPEPEPAPEPVNTLPASEKPSGSGFSSISADTPAADAQNMVSAFYEGNSSSRAQQENLPLPAPVDTFQHPPMLPIDITSTSDQELSRISTQFDSCFARTQWLLSQEEGRRDAAEYLEREAERDAYVQAYEVHRSEIPEEKQTQPTALEAARKVAEKDAEMAEPVRSYRSRKVRHAIDARELKALANGYEKKVFRIKDEIDRRTYLARSSASVK